MPVTTSDDPLLYEQVYLLLAEEEQREQRGERRTAKRSPYEQWQLIAPYQEGKRPLQRDFRYVKCCDLAPGGLSFVTKEEPCEKYVIALGGAPFSFFVMQVVHCRPQPQAIDGTQIVGCKFLGRLK